MDNIKYKKVFNIDCLSIKTDVKQKERQYTEVKA